MSRVFRLIAIIIVLLSWNLSAEDWSKVYKDSLDKHLVKVDLWNKDEPTKKGASCTGVIVGPRHVLTAAHCIWIEDNVELIGEVEGRKFTPIKADGEVDLVLLDVQLRRGKSPITIPFTGPSVGKPIAGIGYAAGDNGPSITSMIVMSYDHGFMLGDSRLYGGYSGGAFLTLDGSLAGIMVRTDYSYSYAVTIPKIRMFLYGSETPQTTREAGLWNSLSRDGQ